MSYFFKKISLLIIIGTMALGAVSLSSAQTIIEIEQNNVDSWTDKIKKIEIEIKQYSNDIEKTHTLQNTLKKLNTQLALTINKLAAEINKTATKVDNTDFKIKQLNSEIIYKKNQIESYNAAISEAIRSIYEYNGRTLVEISLSNESFSGLWDDIEAINQFNDTVRVNTGVVKTLKSDLENKQGIKRVEKKNLLDLQTELSDRKKITEDTKREKTRLLTETNNQEIVFQKLLKEKKVLKKAFEKELNEAESRLKFLLDPNSIPPRGTKVFSAPLDNVHITQNFGKTSASGRLYASGTHNGTDFRARTPVRVMAMADGIVAGSGDTDVTCQGASFGKWVLIRYKNGLAATFAHLSLTKVSAGDKVSAGTVIGYTGNTGYSTGPHLHLSVYANLGVNIETLPSKSCGGRTYTLPLAAFSAYLDPMDYL